MEWVHCNNCFVMPSSSKPVTFFLTNCGHLICKKCLKDEALGTSDFCLVCKKSTQYTEINRNLRPDMKLLFNHPKDVILDSMQKIKSVVDFQNFHRSRLNQHMQTKCQKAGKYVRGAQAEVAKHVEFERGLMAERNEARGELDKEKKRVRELEAMMAEKDQELKRLRINRQSPFIGQKVFPSLNGPTPIGTMTSFTQRILPCATSTPIVENDIFTELHGTLRNSNKNILGKTICNNMGDILGKNLNTPAMLGIGTGKNNDRPLMADAFFS